MRVGGIEGGLSIVLKPVGCCCSVSAMSRNDEKLKKLLDEVTSSEAKYVACLELIVEKYAIPLKQLGRKGDVELLLINRIFSNIEDLYNFHKLFFSTLKEQITAAGIANTFLKYADFLKMYTLFVNNYDRCCDAVDRLRKNDKFQSFLAHARKDKSSQGNNLMSFLIMPVQVWRGIAFYRFVSLSISDFFRSFG